MVRIPYGRRDRKRGITKIFQNTEYAAWRSLRESEDARYLG
ncbi:type VI secretion system contractile sheath domain-containing protein, partial [Klebsiella aerogenes]